MKMYALTTTVRNDGGYDDYYYYPTMFIGIADSWNSVYLTLASYVQKHLSDMRWGVDIYKEANREGYDKLRDANKYTIGEVKYMENGSLVTETFEVYECEV